MKIVSGSGKGVGKLGKDVYYINHGVQLKRDYTSAVSNPNTSAQVSQRSRFKLASQVAAAMEPVIAIPRKGMVSGRNRFIKENMGYFYGFTDGAAVSYGSLQLTLGTRSIPEVKVTRETEGNTTSLQLYLSRNVENNLDRVVYNVFKLNEEGQPELVLSQVVDNEDGEGVFNIEVNWPWGDVVALAYGMKFKDAAARAKYGNYSVNSGSDIAQLIANRTISDKDYFLTRTSGVFLAADDAGNVVPEEGYVTLNLTRVGHGSILLKVNNEAEVTVGTSNVLVPVGASVRLTATATSAWAFVGWYNNGSQQLLSSANPLTLTASTNLDLVCKFDLQGLE